MCLDHICASHWFVWALMIERPERQQQIYDKIALPLNINEPFRRNCIQIAYIVEFCLGLNEIVALELSASSIRGGSHRGPCPAGCCSTSYGRLRIPCSFLSCLITAMGTIGACAQGPSNFNGCQPGKCRSISLPPMWRTPISCIG